MKLPLNAVLYVLSAGLLGQAGLWFYQAAPKLGAEPPETFTHRGQANAVELLAKGKAKATTGAIWIYADLPWWEHFKTANFIGKLPPPPEDPGPPPGPVVPLTPLDTPLEQIIELIVISYESPAKDEPDRSYILVRYTPEANPQPPEDVLRRIAAAAAGPRLGGPGDSVAALQGRQNGRGARTMTSMPVATGTGPELVHTVKVGETLWKPHDHIKLVAVTQDAESAFFVRVRPTTDPAVDPTAEPKREELFKSSMQMSQAVEKTLAEQRRSGRAASGAVVGAGTTAASKWVDVTETQRIGDTWFIGRDDETAFGQDPDRFLENIHVDTYQSRYDPSVRGVQIRGVDPKLGQRYGVGAGDVLLSINNTPVKSKSDAFSIGRKMYDRGVRTFVGKFMSNGQIVERTYQAPDKK